jgi:hypothetical protein
MPINTYIVDIEHPFAIYKNIYLIEQDAHIFPNFLDTTNFCKLYRASFTLDFSEIDISKEEIINFNAFLNFKLRFNEDVLGSFAIDGTQDDLDFFINELNNENKWTSFNYSNCFYSNELFGSFEIPNKFYLNTKNKNDDVIDNNVLYYAQNEETDNLSKPLINFVDIFLNNSFIVRRITYNFYYSFYNQIDIKKISYIEEKNLYAFNSYQVTFEKNMLFDEETGELYISLDGVKGLYIPKDAIGYYEIKVTIENDENTKVYCFRNNFSFANENNVEITCKLITINNIENYERMEFNG